jgi:hypothetical protein
MPRLATDLVSSFGQTVTVTRFASGEVDVDEHVMSDGATSTFDCVMAVQPDQEDQLSNSPSGQRTRNVLKGYTATELFTAEISPTKNADRVTVDGVVYEVQGIKKYVGDLSHWKVRLVEMGE